MPDEAGRLLRQGTPFLDVRAPVEFARATLPGATNLPLMTDAERQRVGITYKQQGHDAAVRVGHRLVSGAVREARVASWVAYARAHPDAWLYCWRGGERSGIACQWLAEAGIDMPRVPGGFKALRQRCMTALDAAISDPRPWLILGGRTGSGKTDLLRLLTNAIDLEGIARHRGSAFGAWDVEQPAPATFENTLAVTWLRHDSPVVVMEDESRTIGRLALPLPWHGRMQLSARVLLEVPFGIRCENIVREYVTEPLARGVSPEHLQERYRNALDRIERRLGGLRRQSIQAGLDAAFAGGDHTAWVAPLLEWYYDPMYDHQLNSRTSPVLLQGDTRAVTEYLRDAHLHC